MQPTDLAGQPIYLDSVLLAPNVQAVESSPGFRLEGVRCMILWIKFHTPGLDLRVFLVNYLKEVFVLLNEVGVLANQEFYALLKLIHFLKFPVEEHDFLVKGQSLVFVFSGTKFPILGFVELWWLY